MATRNQRRRNNKLTNDKVEILEKKRRNHPAMWVISIIILVVIVVTFVGAPVAGKMSSNNSTSFGSYDGEEIKYYEGSYFADQVNVIAENYRDSMTDDNAQFIQFQVWRTAFNNAVYRTAAIKELKNSGVKISGNAVDEAIVLYGPYMENGEFSENLYAQSSNTEKKYIRDRFQEDLYFQHFVNDINNSIYSDKEKDFYREIGSVEKKLKLSVFPFSDFPDDKVVEYGTQNSELFRTIIISKITVNSSKGDAEQIFNKLADAPAMFTELAKTQSTDPYADKGGEMGSRYYYEMKNLISDEKALDEIFALGQGEISSVIEGEGNWVIYRCDKPAEYADLNLASDVAVVKDYMNRYSRGVIEDYLVEKAENFSEFASNVGFDKAAADSGIKVYETNMFPVVYGNPAVYYYNQDIPIYTQPLVEEEPSVLAGAVNNEFFLKSIQKLDMNDISEALILDEKVIVAQLIDENVKPMSELEAIPSFVGYAGQNWVGSQHKDFIFESDKFEDNFASVFTKIFIAN